MHILFVLEWLICKKCFWNTFHDLFWSHPGFAFVNCDIEIAQSNYRAFDTFFDVFNQEFLFHESGHVVSKWTQFRGYSKATFRCVTHSFFSSVVHLWAKNCQSKQLFLSKPLLHFWREKDSLGPHECLKTFGPRTPTCPIIWLKWLWILDCW